MASKIIKTSVSLEELLEVFFHKFMYYVPSKIIYGNVKKLLKDQIADDFYDTFYFIDNTLGRGTFNWNS